MEKSKAAVMNASSKPAFLTTIVLANSRAKTVVAARIVSASVTLTTAEPGACPDIAIVARSRLRIE